MPKSIVSPTNPPFFEVLSFYLAESGKARNLKILFAQQGWRPRIDLPTLLYEDTESLETAYLADITIFNMPVFRPSEG